MEKETLKKEDKQYQQKNVKGREIESDSPNNPDVFDEANYYRDNQHEIGGEDRKEKSGKDKKH